MLRKCASDQWFLVAHTTAAAAAAAATGAVNPTAAAAAAAAIATTAPDAGPRPRPLSTNCLPRLPLPHSHCCCSAATGRHPCCCHSLRPLVFPSPLTCALVHDLPLLPLLCLTLTAAAAGLLLLSLIIISKGRGVLPAADMMHSTATDTCGEHLNQQPVSQQSWCTRCNRMPCWRGWSQTRVMDTAALPAMVSLGAWAPSCCIPEAAAAATTNCCYCSSPLLLCQAPCTPFHLYFCTSCPYSSLLLCFLMRCLMVLRALALVGDIFFFRSRLDRVSGGIDANTHQQHRCKLERKQQNSFSGRYPSHHQALVHCNRCAMCFERSPQT